MFTAFTKSVLVSIFIFGLFTCSCKSKPANENEKHFISVRSIIEKQVAHVDTSLFSIIKITITDSTHSDTVYIPREEFRTAAKDFLEVPDLSDPVIASRYNEENRYDSLINSVIITYTPIKPKEEEIQKQELLISPDIIIDSSNKITSIIINRVKQDRNGFFGQQMLWLSDKSFLISTTTQQPNKHEKVIVTKVIWNDEQID